MAQLFTLNQLVKSSSVIASFTEMMLDAVWIKMNSSAWINWSWGLFLLLLRNVSHSQLFAFISNQTLVHRWTGSSSADDCRWEFSNKKSNLAPTILHLSTNTHILVRSAVFSSSCLESASVSSYWHSMESFGLMLGYYNMSGFPVLEKPVNRSGHIRFPWFLALMTAGGPFGKVAITQRQQLNSNAGPAFDRR